MTFGWWQDLVAQPVRRVPVEKKTLFLTFDDGPSPDQTEKVLDLLAENQVPATFFIIGEKARRHHRLVKRTMELGHSIGNHSLDHRYSSFFLSRQKMWDWIHDSEALLGDMIGERSIGFRPPAGVCTPPLHSVLVEKNIPLILWSIRYYDTMFPWSQRTALKSLAKAQPGDIILLHDSTPKQNMNQSLQTLQYFITAARKSGFGFEALKKEYLMTRS